MIVKNNANIFLLLTDIQIRGYNKFFGYKFSNPVEMRLFKKKSITQHSIKSIWSTEFKPLMANSFHL